METRPVIGKSLADRDATAMAHIQKQQAQRGCSAAVAHQPAVEAKTPAVNSVLNCYSCSMLILHQLYVLEELSRHTNQ